MNPETGKVELPESKSRIIRFCNAVFRSVEAPGDWIKNNIVRPNQKNYPYYHEQKRRVPLVDECYEDDLVCMFEADQQLKRDKSVESFILNILRVRFEACVLYEGPDSEKCLPLFDIYKEAEENWFIKYGDLSIIGKAKDCYMKQKHRMIWERRYGPVGTGMNYRAPPPQTETEGEKGVNVCP